MATGKISRLPREIREQVNERLDAGEPGNRLVAWLNELPEVRALLAEEFGGAAINEQNLTNWKQGGFREWRVERDVRAFTQQAAGTVPVVTPEQLVTSAAVRYLLLTVREWQQSPVPSERRWRLMRVILRDVLKLQRQGQKEQWLELGREKLQFAKERLEFAKEQFEAGKQSDVRRVMTAFLVAAKQWPEVQEALAGAFRLLQERKRAGTGEKESELKPIKVNQGEKISEKEEAQKESVTPLQKPTVPSRSGNATPYPHPCRAGARRSEFAGQRPALPVVGAPGFDEDLAELKPINVNQGGFFIKTSRTRTRRKTRKIHPCALAPPEAQARLDSHLPMSFNQVN